MFTRILYFCLHYVFAYCECGRLYTAYTDMRG